MFTFWQQLSPLNLNSSWTFAMLSEKKDTLGTMIYHWMEVIHIYYLFFITTWETVVKTQLFPSIELRHRRFSFLKGIPSLPSKTTLDYKTCGIFSPIIISKSWKATNLYLINNNFSNEWLIGKESDESWTMVIANISLFLIDVQNRIEKKSTIRKLYKYFNSVWKHVPIILSVVYRCSVTPKLFNRPFHWTTSYFNQKFILLFEER